LVDQHDIRFVGKFHTLCIVTFIFGMGLKMYMS
jgi:hypothetical protein